MQPRTKVEPATFSITWMRIWSLFTLAVIFVVAILYMLRSTGRFPPLVHSAVQVALPGVYAQDMKVWTISPLQPAYIREKYDALLKYGLPGETCEACRWNIKSGHLPPGLRLDASNGRITGVPIEGGKFSFTAQVTERKGETASKDFLLDVFGLPLDEYGGFADEPSLLGGTKYFHLEIMGNRWAVVDPAGNYDFTLFVEDVTPYDGDGAYRDAIARKYAAGVWTQDTWTIFANQSVKRLRGFGFNALGLFAAPAVLPVPTYGNGVPCNDKMPFADFIKPSLYGVRDGGVEDLIFGTDPAIYRGWRGASFPDIFSPLFDKAIRDQINGKVRFYGKDLDHSPWLVYMGMDDLDNLFGWRNSKAPHTGWLAAVSSPVETLTVWPQYNYFKTLHSDPQVYTKAQWAMYLEKKYSSIRALNAAWGSNYTTFGSSGKPVERETIGTGDGVTRAFAGKLAHTSVDPHSVAVQIENSIASGDDGSGHLYDNARILNESPIGTIDYQTGAITVEFSTPPSSGVPINVSYIYGGWPKRIEGGRGLLDEDGSSSWIGRDYSNLADAKPAVRDDLDSFFRLELDTYFSKLSSAIQDWLPHHIIFGTVGLSAWARPEVFQEAGKYVRLIDVSAADGDVQPAGGLAKAFLSAFSNFRNPISASTIVTSQRDSSWSKYPRTMGDYPTQTGRGQAYASQLNSLIHLRALDEDYFVVDFDIFAWTDKRSEKGNFGLVSNLDNAYDGQQDVAKRAYDSWGYLTGGEASDYGDFIDSVRRANLNALQAVHDQLEVLRHDRRARLTLGASRDLPTEKRQVR